MNENIYIRMGIFYKQMKDVDLEGINLKKNEWNVNGLCRNNDNN